jgi:hypothetical protein
MEWLLCDEDVWRPYLSIGSKVKQLFIRPLHRAQTFIGISRGIFACGS